ncbi:MAG TPA: LpqB family beta-propeller domain-containing protein, partial [Microbacterium sp.]|nr:LpqB family beta-propeller domain-containing protein [Microbacterium sp.]
MMMRASRRLAFLGAVLALAVALTACGGLPTSGPVNAGRPVSDDESGGEVVFLPDGPAPDATPQQIVEGFIAAGSGPRGNWETAKEFLAPEFTTWDPGASVTIYAPGDRGLEEVSESEFVLSVTPLATVDAAGELSTPGEPGEIALGFTLAEQSDGQWRITKAPDGIVLDRSLFSAVFSAYALQFFDPTWTYLVPDERWFPRLYARTNIAEALVNGGPSPWLAASVATAFTDGARLAVATVPLSADVAQVSLEEGARQLDGAILDRMQTQLEASLATANVDAVDMLVDGQLLAAEAVPVQTTRVDARPLVRTADAFGFASGTTVEEIAGLSEVIVQVDATDIEVNASRTAAAVRQTNGAVVRVSGDGGIDPVDDRAGLVAPSIDPFDYLWTVPSATPGAVVATGADGAAIDIPDAWTGAVQVLAKRVSRDGTRLAAVVRAGE